MHVSQLHARDIPRLTRETSIFTRPLKFYCAPYTRERNPLSSLHENAMRPPLHPLNEHRSPAANPSRRAAHIHLDNVIPPAMPIKHQNGALLRQLYGITADGWWRRRRRWLCDDRFAICQQSSRKTIQPSAGASRRVRRKKVTWKKNERWEEGGAEGDYGVQSERCD